jgi:hypothetical protein
MLMMRGFAFVPATKPGWPGSGGPGGRGDGLGPATGDPEGVALGFGAGVAPGDALGDAAALGAPEALGAADGAAEAGTPATWLGAAGKDQLGALPLVQAASVTARTTAPRRRRCGPTRPPIVVLPSR